MEKIMKENGFLQEKTQFIGNVLLGCLFISLCSCIKIPMYPVSFTLHTFAISMIALKFTPKQALASVLCYLACGSLGLPVFSGLANPLWIMGKCGGYYIGFLVAAFLMAKAYQKLSAIAALSIGHAIILFFGFLWLIPFVGVKTALFKGLLIFIPSDIIKILAVSGVLKFRNL